VGIGANFLTAEEKNHQYMVFEGLSDEENGGFDGQSEQEDVEAFEDDGVSHR
jgi:hypothetical protein